MLPRPAGKRKPWNGRIIGTQTNSDLAAELPRRRTRIVTVRTVKDSGVGNAIGPYASAVGKSRPLI
jgi:hypothetical protein